MQGTICSIVILKDLLARFEMSNSNSSLWKLQKQAKKMAHRLKRPGVLPKKTRVTFGIVMDDKIVAMEMLRVAIVQASEEALAAMIVREMQGKKADA